MEALRALARSNFARQGFATDPSLSSGKSDVLSIYAPYIQSADQEPSLARCEKVTVDHETLVASLTGDNDDSSAAQVKIVSIRRANSGVLRIEEETFLNLFSSFGLDECALQLLVSNTYGFHGFKSNTFYVGTVFYFLIWRFDPAKLRTRAIIFPRDGNGLEPTSTTIHYFRKILFLHKDCIFAPSCLALVASIQTIHFADKFIQRELQEIRSMEAYTGHGAWRLMPGLEGQIHDIDEITEWSKRISRCINELANQFRHENIALALLAFVGNENFAQKSWREHIPAVYLQTHNEATRLVQSVTSILEDQVYSGKEHIIYLQERAKGQSAVLLSLLSHQDSITNLQAAKANQEVAEASRQIAEATRRDSASMKTVAIMTMAFLPATFFAALFAMPSLQWDQPTVISSRFWIYWAFSLPSTGLVFLVWFLITNWESAVMSFIRRPKKDET